MNTSFIGYVKTRRQTMDSLIATIKSVQNIIKDTDLVAEKEFIKNVLLNIESGDTQINTSELIDFLSTTTNKIDEVSLSLSKQHNSDFAIVSQINKEIDEFRVVHNHNIKSLIHNLNREIVSEIDSYKNEIILKLNPHKLEQFSTKSKFEAWLAKEVNDDYFGRLIIF